MMAVRRPVHVSGTDWGKYSCSVKRAIDLDFASTAGGVTLPVLDNRDATSGYRPNTWGDARYAFEHRPVISKGIRI